MSTLYERPERDRGELGNSGANRRRPPPPPPDPTTPERPPGQQSAKLTERRTKASGAPSTIKYAYVMWLVVAVLIVLLALVQALAPSGLTRSLRLVDLVIGTALALVFASGCVFSAIRMREGANWARVVLTVIALLSIVSLIIYLIIGSVDWINALVAIVAGVLMWMPGSQAWFKEHSKAAAQH